MNQNNSSNQPQTQVMTRVESGQAGKGPPAALLVVIQGPELGKQFVLGSGALTLGRSPDCDVRLSAPGVSRQHCRIEPDQDHYRITDQGSTNHTRINEAVVETHLLGDGDRIRLGQTVLKFIGTHSPEAAYHEKVQQDASRDGETGLFNRQHFMGMLEAAVEEASTTPEEYRGGVLYLALDAPGTLRERIGIGGVDRLMGLAGQRLCEFLDSEHVPARFGEHSLAVLVRHHDAGSLVSLAEQIGRLISGEVFEIDGGEVAAAASIGICPFNLRIGDADSMLVCATRAAEQAQEAGGNRYELYQPTVSAAGASENERTMLGLLNEALRRNTLQVMFQPAVSTREEDITQYQLLPRLLTDDDQLIAAADFIPVAERHGEVGKLDRWMTVRALGVIRDRLGKDQPLRLFISQSAESIADAERFDALADRLERDIARQRLLVIEFRHRDLMDHLKPARKLLPRLRELGLGISVSEVGEKAAADLLLSHFTIDYLKMSPEWAREIGNDEIVTGQFESMAEAIHDAGVRIIVPQVEDAETMSRLWNSKVDLLQGNFIQKPSQVPDFRLGE